MIIDGFADIGLCEAGKQLDADLSITGTHGRSGLSRFLMGSVAERVVRHYHRNVMVARPGAEHKRAFERILVPTDFSPDAEDALRLALVLIAPGGTIELFHAWDTPPELALEWTGPILDELAEDANQAGEELLKRYQSSERTIVFESVRAGAVTGIEQRLHEREYDLVVMGSHGRRGIKRFLLGSVAEKIVRHAPCSVIVVHHRE
jgi:nucleotide-binding universal stress UspA family protein